MRKHKTVKDIPYENRDGADTDGTLSVVGAVFCGRRYGILFVGEEAAWQRQIDAETG